MLVLTEPVNQSRLNACVYDQLNYNMNGDVAIPGEWDCYDTLGYLERRLKQSIIATLADDGSKFAVKGKIIVFEPDSVYISHYNA